MELILTSWALNSYLELLGNHTFSKEEFFGIIKPDVLLLKDGFPSPHEKFKLPKFWGPATTKEGKIQNAYKMKWHNMGEGKVQLRLCVVILNHSIYVCNGYVKDDKSDAREMAKLKGKVVRIKEGNFVKQRIL